MSFPELISKARGSIHLFADRILRFRATPQQTELFDIIQNEQYLPFDQRKRRIAIKSGQGVGKTAVMCVVALYRTFRYIDSLTVTMGPTKDQLSAQFFAELKRVTSKAVPEFQAVLDTPSAIKQSFCGREHWCIRGRTTKDAGNAAGFHQTHMTYIFDESSNIHRDIWETVKGTLSNPDSLFIASGNPLHVGTAHAECFQTQKDLWHNLTWSSEDSPYTDKSNIERLEREFGRDSNTFKVRVLGQFPSGHPNSVIAYDDCLKCTETRVDFMSRLPLNAAPMRQIGIDFARFGDDESVIAVRCNRAIVLVKAFRNTEPIDVVRAAFKIQKELRWSDATTFYTFDSVGIGGGVAFAFYEAGKNLLEFAANAVAYDQEQYCDRSTESYFQFAKEAKSGLLHIPKDIVLIQQLASRKYKDKAGRPALESKKDFKARQGTEGSHSPDRADAVVMACYHQQNVTARVDSMDEVARITGVRVG